MDRITKAQRSYIMSRVRGKDTAPELFVRSLCHRLGYRFRLHRKDLPGKPDLVFPARRKVIFVHGCFWHGHHCAHGARKPKTNTAYWTEKIEGNRSRDQRNRRALKRLGWRTLTLWECRLKEADAVAPKLVSFLED